MHTLTFYLSQGTVKGALPRGSVTKGNGRLYILASFWDPSSFFVVFCLSSIWHFSTLRSGRSGWRLLPRGPPKQKPHFVLDANDGRKIRPVCACSNNHQCHFFVINLLSLHNDSEYCLSLHEMMGQPFSGLVPSEVVEICRLS